MKTVLPTAPPRISRISHLSLIGVSLLALLFVGCGLFTLSYTCPGGTPRSGNAPDSDSQQYCIACNNPQYTAVNGQCVPTRFTCNNGTEKEGIADANFTREHCTSCERGYALTDDNHCESVLDFINIQEILQETIGADSVTAQVTLSENAQLWWVLYEGDTTVADANTVISDARRGGGVQRSSTLGTNITRITPHRITINTLAPATDYTLYVAINNDAAPQAVLSNKLSFTTVGTEAPAFTNQPTITASTRTAATIFLSAERATKLDWVLYDSAPTALTADTLITDATANGGVQRGSNTTTITNGSATINIGQLTPQKPYYFYAALTDSYGTPTLSDLLTITTSGYPYVCSNGTPKSGTTTTENITNCLRCDSTFRLDDDNSCVPTVYTCVNGEAADGSPPGNDDVPKCGNCDSGYRLHNDACVATKYTCDNGNAATGSPPGNADVEQCTSCFGGYKPKTDDNSCTPTIYTCTNGTPAGGSPTGNIDVALCIACSAGYVLESGACRQAKYTCSNGTPASGNPTTGNADVPLCSTSCNPGYVPENGACRRARYICSGGNPATGNPSLIGNSDVPKCDGCHSGFKPNGDSCQPTIYTCQNGTPLSGSPAGNADVALCIRCNPGYVQNGTACRRARYTCTNGEPVAGNPSTGDSDVERCDRCDPGYDKNSANMCVTVTYPFICHHGEPVSGFTSVANVIKCAMCDTGYRPNENNNDECIANFHTCTHGEAASGRPAVHRQQKCASCNGGYTRAGNICRAAMYTCTNGTPASGGASAPAGAPSGDVELCDHCDLGYVPDGNGCAQFLTNVDNVFDSGSLHLQGAKSVATAVVTGTTYLFVAGAYDDGVSVFSVSSAGQLTNVFNIDHDDDDDIHIEDSNAITTAVIGDDTYLFTVGEDDDDSEYGVSAFRINSNGSLTSTDDEEDSSTRELDDAWSVTSARVGSKVFVFVAGADDDGVSVFEIRSNGRLYHEDSVDDADNSNYNIQDPASVTTARAGGSTYLFVAGNDDDGVSVFRVKSSGTLENVDNLADEEAMLAGGSLLKFNSPRSATTAIINGSTYLFVSASLDQRVNVFSVNGNGLLEYVDTSVINNGQLVSITTTSVGGKHYLFSTYTNNSTKGLIAFSIANDGSLTQVANIQDNDNLALDSHHLVPQAITTGTVGSNTFLFVAGFDDNGVSVFKIQ